MVESAEKELSTRPELKPLLLAKLQREYFEARKVPGKKGDVTALSILALRSDLTESELKPITDELEKRIQEIDADFNFVAVSLLRHYPSPAHEAIVLRFLELNDSDERHIKSAFRTLHEIGGIKSLAAMEQVAVQKKAQNPQCTYLEEMNQYIVSLDYSLKHQGGRSVNNGANSLPEGEAGKSKTGGIAVKSSPHMSSDTNSVFAWLWIIGGLALVIFITTCRKGAGGDR